MNPLTALYLGEGTSDLPLADLIQAEFLEADVDVQFTSPDLARLGQRVGPSLPKRLEASFELLGATPDVLAIHRDGNSVGRDKRVEEMYLALNDVIGKDHPPLVAVVPQRMTEAFLVVDEVAIRSVAGKPNGTAPLNLPSPREAERLADPKSVLRDAILAASEERGRRRQQLSARFGSQRRQLLEGMDRTALLEFAAWRLITQDIQDAVVALLG